MIAQNLYTNIFLITRLLTVLKITLALGRSKNYLFQLVSLRAKRPSTS